MRRRDLIAAPWLASVLWTVRVILAVELLWGAALYGFGPDRLTSSGSFRWVHVVPVPIEAWAVAWAVAGLLLLSWRFVEGHALAGVVYTFWTGLIAAALFSGDLTAGRAVGLNLTVTLMHWVLLFTRVRGEAEQAAARGGR